MCSNNTGDLVECLVTITQLEAGITTQVLSPKILNEFLSYTTRTWTNSKK